MTGDSMIMKAWMIMKTGGRSCRHQRRQALRMAIGAMVFSLAGCTGQNLGAQTGNGDTGAEVQKFTQTPDQKSTQTSTPPVLRKSTRQDNIDPSMRPDPEAFHVIGLGLWDGERTLPGVWIAYPKAVIARRVRLTNDETGAQADAAMFRRDPNLSGPRIIVSSEAAERLGLTPGHATQMTIDALTYGDHTETASVTASPVEEPEPAPAEVPAGETATEPAAPEVAPLATASADPPAALEPAATEDAVEGADGSEPDLIDSATESAGKELEPSPIDPNPTPIPKPRPHVTPGDPVPDVSGEITDGRHFIQAGIFGQPGNAARLMEKLRTADLPVDKMPLILSGRALTRVLIGPYRTVAERDTALEIVRRLGPADATLIQAPTPTHMPTPTQATAPTPTQG
jgi:hypothetical protein